MEHPRSRDTDRARAARRPAREPDPQLPEGVSWYDLDPGARRALRSLPKDLAERVGAHLAAAGLLVDEDCELARKHAAVARRLASRVGVAREAMGLTAYACGDFETALTELRAHRRMTGEQSHLPLLVDCERALGRADRALELASSVDERALPAEVARELRIVTASIRRDEGHIDAALAVLEGDPALRRDPAAARLTASAHSEEASSLDRLFLTYADLLEQAGRPLEAERWYSSADR